MLHLQVTPDAVHQIVRIIDAPERRGRRLAEVVCHWDASWNAERRRTEPRCYRKAGVLPSQSPYIKISMLPLLL